MTYFFYAKFAGDGSVLEQRKEGALGLSAAQQIAEGFSRIPLPEGRAYGSWETYHRENGFTWPAWERNWSGFRDLLTGTPEFMSVDTAAESSTRLSHRLSSLNATLTNLVKDGPTPGEFNRFLYQWGRFQAAIADETIPNYTGVQILGKIGEIAETLGIDLDHGGINLSGNASGLDPNGNGVGDP